MKLKKLLLIAVLMIPAMISQAQIWEVGYTSMTFVDASRGNRTIDANIYYPADVTGTNVPLGSPIDKRFPIIVFGHDEGVTTNNYQYTWDRWVPKGFIVVMPSSEMGPVMDVEEFAKDMAYIAAQFKVMRNTPGNLFYMKHNNRSAMIGHGKGASAAVVATQYYGQIKALITLAADETTPSAIANASLVTLPSVVVAAGQDCESPVGTVQEAIFNNLASDCKTFINFTEVPSCHFAQNSGLCTPYQVTCSGTGPYSWQSTAVATTYYLVSFMRHFLKSNEPAFDKFEWKLAQKKKDFLYVVMCNESSPRLSAVPADDEDRHMLAEEDFAVITTSFYPNPVARGGELTISVEADMATKAELIITNLMGQVVSVTSLELNEYQTELTVPTGDLSKGNYLLTVTTGSQRVSRPLIIH